MEYTKNSLAELWLLLKNKQKEFGIDQLGLKERETLQHITYLQGQNDSVKLEKVYIKNPFPRASFFRYLKKLKQDKYIFINSCQKDSRKTLISVSSILVNSN